MPSLASRPDPRASRTLKALALALVTVVLVSGCGGTEKKKPTVTPQQVMQQAKKQLDDASSVHLELATDSVPTEGNGVLGASGDITHDPAFEGDVKVLLSGITATVPVTSVGGRVYAKLPLTTRYATIDPAEYGAPDPADFADPENGLSGLLTQMDDLKKGAEIRSGEQILTRYSGTLPGAAVKKVIPSANAKETYKTVVGVDEKGYARTVKVTGVFFSGNQDVTYDMLLSSYDKGVKITAPTA